MNIWTNGCYDILHVGHLKLFEFAKNLRGRRNRLIVGIDSDKRVRELKGGNRPINNQEDRKRMLEALKVVDEVFIYDSAEELASLVKECKIDYMVVGEEYKDRWVVGRENSKHDVVFFPKDGNSTTNILNKI
jgi:rfaE bifunctional protein nucleotidyltransferase chain/domain